MAKVDYSKYKIITHPDSVKKGGFIPGDVVRREYYEHPRLIYSLMVVTETGTDIIGENESHYFIGALIEGDEPKTGELLDFVRVTSLVDRRREGALYLTASNDDSPYMDIIDGLGSQFSLSYPDRLKVGTSTPGKDYYVGMGGNTFSYEYKASEGETTRIARVTRNSIVPIPLPGLKVIMEERIVNPEKIIISYRARASEACEDMVVTFAYSDGDGMDYREPVILGKEWEYHVGVLTIDWAGTKPKALNFNLLNDKTRIGQWMEIGDLTIIRLTDLSNFGKATKGRTGKLTGVVDPVFGVLDGYGAYFQNLYATRNVNIAGTLTAGDENGFASTFYVGKIHKNVLLNSICPEFSGQKASVSKVDNPVGIGNSYELGFGKTLVVQSQEWASSRIGQRYCFSVWLQCNYKCLIKISQNGQHFADFLIPDGKQWMRYSGSFALCDTNGSDVLITFDSQYAGPVMCAPQLEAGFSPSQYQATDGTLSYMEDYGAWFSKGGIGGTIQNPLLRLNDDGSISSRDGSFVINSDGTGHFADGRFRWSKDTITLQDVTIRWEDLDDDARENLKGETGEAGRDGQDAYSLVITSSGGQIFRPSGVSTTLNATLYYGATDITYLIPAGDYRWTRSSDDPIADTLWNKLDLTGYGIDICPDDVSQRAVFDCQVSLPDDPAQGVALITDMRHNVQRATLSGITAFSQILHTGNVNVITLVDVEDIFNMVTIVPGKSSTVDLTALIDKQVLIFIEPLNEQEASRAILSFE